MIFVSTGGYFDWSFEQTIEYLSKDNINSFELSGGAYVQDIKRTLKNFSKIYNISLHNYFPPAKKPFVFNLASLDHNIVKKSMDHAKHAVDLSYIAGSKYYSLHAGFLIDPTVNELGKQIRQRKLNDKNESKNVFIERVNELSRYAKDKGIQILIENNVISQKNFLEFKCNPLLMVDQSETEEILAKTNENVGLLIDVAHLKVSAKTLNFSPENYLLNFKETAKAYHFSDNQGFEDSNELISKNSWFWPYINKNLDYYSLEIYNVSSHVLKQQLELTYKCLG
jgi:sugar phosphate isomerase/epimerase